jgi:GST-like protein
MNTELVQHSYLAGEEYTIADMVTYPWIAGFLQRAPELFETAPAVRRWAQTISERPAAQKTAATYLNH